MLKNGRLVRDTQGKLQGLSGSAAWAICKHRGAQGGHQAAGADDLRRTWTGHLLDFEGLQLATFNGIAAPPRAAFS